MRAWTVDADDIHVAEDSPDAISAMCDRSTRRWNGLSVV